MTGRRLRTEQRLDVGIATSRSLESVDDLAIGGSRDRLVDLRANGRLGRDALEPWCDVEDAVDQSAVDADQHVVFEFQIEASAESTGPCG